MSLIGSFVNHLIPFLLRETKIDDRKHFNIIKQHTDKLKTNGDIGFSTSIKAWLPLTNGNLSTKVIDEIDLKFHNQLIDASQEWIFPIKRIQCTDDRCVLFLNRSKCIENILKHVLNKDTKIGCSIDALNSMETGFFVSLILHDDEDSLTRMRCTMIRKTLVNMLQMVGYMVETDEEKSSEDTVNVVVTHSRRRDEQRKETKNPPNQLNANKIVCGIVKSGQNLSAEDYIG